MNKEELIGKLQMVYVGDRNALNEMIGYYDELFDEMESWREEVKELKKQLEEINKMIEKCGFVNIEQVMLSYCGLIVQQKEFINYLTSYIELLSNKPDLIEENQKDILEEILSKYKSIIGGKE